jgi:hypothetical protein
MPSVTVQGSDGSTLVFDGETVEITRKGGFASQHRKGSKRIPVRSVAAIQFKEPGITVGFMQFTIGSDSRGNAKRGGAVTEALRDENAIVFKKSELENFQKVRDLIELAMHSTAPVANAAPATSLADELAKLASLRDSGVLTNAEFEAQKARLLG